MLYGMKWEGDAEMKLFDFLMTPDGGGSERLVGKYFHNMFVLHIASKAALEGEGDETERGSPEMWI